MTTRPLGQAGNDLAKRLGKIASATERGRKDTLVAAGLAGKDIHTATIRRDSGGDSRLSGVGKRGAKVGARFDIKGDRVVMKATGPLHFVAHPMQPHRIPKKRGSRARRRYVVIPGVGVRSSAQHPGTRGKNTWNRASRRAQ